MFERGKIYGIYGLIQIPAQMFQLLWVFGIDRSLDPWSYGRADEVQREGGRKWVCQCKSFQLIMSQVYKAPQRYKHSSICPKRCGVSLPDEALSWDRAKAGSTMSTQIQTWMVKGGLAKLFLAPWYYVRRLGIINYNEVTRTNWCRVPKDEPFDIDPNESVPGLT